MQMVWNEALDRFDFISGYEERFVLKENRCRWDPKAKVWWTKREETACRFEKVADPESKKRIAKASRLMDKTAALSRATDSDMVFRVPEGLDYMPFQKAGIEFCTLRPSTLIGDEMGLGKTIQVLGAINADPGIKRALIVCPASLKLNWKREIEKWIIRPMSVGIINGKNMAQHRAVDITIVNYDILTRFRATLIESDSWDLLAFDEAHYVKNAKAQRSKALKVIASKCFRKMALTGTPIVNRPIELYNILDILRPDLFPNFMDYAKRYCDARHNRFGWDFSGSSNLEELQATLRRTVMIRRLKSEVLTDLPAKTRTLIELESDTSDLRKALKQEKAVDMTRLAAVLGEYDIEDLTDGQPGFKDIADAARKRHDTALAKAPAVADFVKDILDSEQKVIVMAWHHDVIHELESALSSFNPVVVTGATPVERRQAAVDSFQTDPSTRVFIGNIKAAGVGLTLTAARTVVFAELDWVPGNISQAEDRAHRIGQKDNVQVYHIVLKGSVDAWLAQSIMSKQAVIRRATDDEVDPEEGMAVYDVGDGGISDALPLTPEERKLNREPVAARGHEYVPLTPEQVEAAHSGIRLVAGDCDGAFSEDNAGFNKLDTRFGNELARRERLTDTQAQYAYWLCRKYHRQISAEILETLEAE